MRVDAHQHFWKYNLSMDSWINDDMSVLRQDYLPKDLEPLLSSNGIDGCVAVQADQTEAETAFLLGLADEYPFINGVVGWVDLKSNSLQEELEKLSDRKKLKGFRHVLQAEPAGYMLNPGFINGVSLLNQFGFTYDILIYESQLSETLSLVQKLPEMRLVIDHLAKPDIKVRSFDQWRSYMSKLAEYPHVQVKVSGMVTEAAWSGWREADFYPYLDFLFEAFGADRLMFGSDWPVCLVAGSYGDVLKIVSKYIQNLSVNEQGKIMGLNAKNFYNLD